MYVYVNMYKHFPLLHCSQNAMTAKIYISLDSKEILCDQAIVSLLKLFENRGQSALAGVKYYSGEHVCCLSTPSNSPVKNIIFVYNLEKKKRDYLLTKAITFKLNNTSWRFSNGLNSWFFPPMILLQVYTLINTHHF